MAKRTRTSSKRTAASRPSLARRLWRGMWRAALLVVLLGLGLIALFAVVNPPTTPYMLSESRRLGGVAQEWVPIEDIAPVMARSAVAAEDANFCTHWGLDLVAIRAALEAGGERGASTISQQVVKNVFLWHGRSWARKALEALLTPVVELVWSKRRILEVYLNVAEFGEGVFGVESASRAWFGIPAADLSAAQAARLAAVLPDPKGRSATEPTPYLRRRAADIADGAATIDRDGRTGCFR